MTETETGVHPGSWVGDSVEEFKKLPVWGKAMAIGLLVLVAYLGYRAYASKGSTSQSGVSSGSLPATSNTSGSSSPFPQISTGPDSSVPLLPGNVNPVFSGSGSLVGYQASASPTPVTPPSQVGATPSTPTTNNPASPVLTNGLLGAGVEILPGNKYRVNGGTPQVLPLGLTNDSLHAGPSGREWYIDSSGNQQLLTSGVGGPVPQPVPKGGGSMSWQSRVYRLAHYTPAYGDNMNEVAAKLGYGNWEELGQTQFKHGERFKLP